MKFSGSTVHCRSIIASEMVEITYRSIIHFEKFHRVNTNQVGNYLGIEVTVEPIVFNTSCLAVVL